MEQKRERVKNWMAACIVMFALCVDLFEMLLTWLGIGVFITPIMVPCVTLIFWIWYKFLDIPFVSSPKKFANLTITSLFELVPGLDAIPLISFGWTISAIIMVITVRAEDKGGVLGQISNTALGVVNQKNNPIQKF